MTGEQTLEKKYREVMERKIKCVVWDLDNTIWDGILLEHDQVRLKDGIQRIIETLDSRGILQSIASRNDFQAAFRKLQEFNLADYFLYPRINWGAKSSSIREIARSLNIGLDTFAFIDDQDFERAEVTYHLPQVLCYDVHNLDKLLSLPEFNPRFITEDSRLRRQMYLSEIRRKEAEESLSLSNEEFLKTLDMEMTISAATEDDLLRAEELTVRTNQLNTTGYTYSYEELNSLLKSANHLLLIASLKDKFGDYGKIGLSLIEKLADEWTIKLFLMSCRVMTRGVGSVFINHILNFAKQNNVRLFAEFLHTDKNRMMYAAYKFAGFREVKSSSGIIILENTLKEISPNPSYIRLRAETISNK
jgi:FkbH-like protein